MSRASFRILRWAAWAPGLSDGAAWRRWAAGEITPADAGLVPAVRFVPALQRRRLNGLSRMLFAVAGAALGEQVQVPVVFHSRHGDLDRTRELLAAIARREPCSPNEFSLSVHNAGPGQWSIFRGNTARVEAIAAASAGLEQALVLAAGILGDGAASVLVAAADTPGPEPFAPFTTDAGFPHALALHLAPGDELSVEPGGDQPADGPTPGASTLEFLRRFPAGAREWRYTEAARWWRWRASAFPEPAGTGD